MKTENRLAIANARIFAAPAPAPESAPSDVILYSWANDDPFDYYGRRDDDRYEYGDYDYDEFMDEYYDVEPRFSARDVDEKRHPMFLVADRRFCVGIGRAAAETVARALLEIDIRLIGRQIGEIRWAQLCGALRDETGRARSRRPSSAPLPLDEAIRRMKSDRLTPSDSIVADLGDGWTLELTEPAFAGWLKENMAASVGA